jgi:hypothetical protein
MHNTEQQKSAIQWCEEISKEMSGYNIDSESMRDEIKSRGGKWFKVSNLERRMRESDKIRSVKVKGKNYVKYRYINDEKQGEMYD